MLHPSHPLLGVYDGITDQNSVRDGVTKTWFVLREHMHFLKMIDYFTIHPWLVSRQHTRAYICNVQKAFVLVLETRSGHPVSFWFCISILPYTNVLRASLRVEVLDLVVVAWDARF